MSVLGVKSRVEGQNPIYRQMRVFPLSSRNIRNIYFYLINIYINQIDKTKIPYTSHRNTVERTGTNTSGLFRKCSGQPFCRNTSTALVDQGLQRFLKKTCSGMFRRYFSPKKSAGAMPHKGYSPFTFRCSACSGPSGGTRGLFFCVDVSRSIEEGRENMQVQVINGPMASGKTTQLRAIQAELKRQGMPVEIHYGVNCTTPYFLNLVSKQAMAGAKYFLADDCTQFQIKAVMELKAKGLHSGIPSDFVLHLVRRA